MTLPALTRQQSREIDRRAIDELGISGLVLMENAGRGCVDVLERFGIGGPVVILCGKGNNAGDGFVIARHLKIRGHECRVLLTCPTDQVHGDAHTNLEILLRTEVRVIDLATRQLTHSPELLLREIQTHIRDAAWIVDALLGTGAIGEPRAPFDTAIDAINLRLRRTRALAVDVPSGLDCDTGAPTERTVVADVTCTFAALKIGYRNPLSRVYTGPVHVCDIGVPLQRLLR